MGEAIREEIATFLTDSAKDPRIVGLVTVTGVDVTPDLRQARVYVSVMGSDDDRRVTLEGLDSLAAHLRSRVGRALRLRSAPEITFKLDETVARAARIEALLAQLRKGDTAGESNAEDPGPAPAADDDPA